MAAMSTSVTQFSDENNRRTWSISGHTISAPRLLIQKRKVPATPSAASENSLQVVYGTKDAANIPLQSKVVFEVTVRYPADGASADVTAALAVFRDVVASDEFTATVTSQNYVKA